MEILEKSCRFCLKQQSSDDRVLELDEHIEQLFYELTQLKVCISVI